MPTTPATCQSPYNWYLCASNGFAGCCAKDVCSLGNLGKCPPDAQPPSQEQAPISKATSTSPPGLGPTTTIQSPTTRSGASEVTVAAVTPTSSPVTGAVSSGGVTGTTPSTSDGILAKQTGATGTNSGPGSGYTSGTIKGTDSSPGSSGSHPGVPIAAIVGAVLGAAFLIALIFIAVLVYLRRKNKTSDGVIAAHGSENPEGLLAFFRHRPRPVSSTETGTLTNSPSLAYTKMPSPSFPHGSHDLSLPPGRAELASPPMSSVSELSTAEKGMYSSTDVSTASASAVVSPVSNETALRGGGRPIMRSNLTMSQRREGRRHVLSWQSLDPEP